MSGIRAQIQDLRVENIAQLASKSRTADDFIPLWYGEGDMTTPALIIDAAKSSLDAGETFYIPDMRGKAGLTEALSQYQSRIHGKHIDVRRSTVTPGGMQAVLLAMELLVDVGSNVVYIEPQWPNIHSAIHVVGGEPRPVPLTFDGNWHLDLEAVFARCDARTRAIFLSTPSNPIGWTATSEELSELLSFSRSTGIWIVTDEVYNRLYYEGDSAPSMLQLAEDDDRVLVVNSFSKAWAMTGWRVGWLTHPTGIADQMSAVTQYVNSGTAAFVQAGAEAAIRHGEPIVSEVKRRVAAGFEVAYEGLPRVPGIVLPHRPKGGMYAFFAFADEHDSHVACARIVEKASVGLSPGYLFGGASRSFLRMCVMRDPKQIGEAIERIVAAMK